MHKTNE